MSAPGSLEIHGGTVVTGGPNGAVLARGTVRVEAGRISWVGPSDAEAGEPAERRIDAAGMIVMPGLVDDHRHLWQTPLRALAADLTAPGYRGDIRGRFGAHYRPEDLYAATLAGALDAIDCGVTTIGDFSHGLNRPDFADAGFEALEASGIRAVFGYGTPSDGDADAWYTHSTLAHPRDIARLADRAKSERVGVMMAARAPYHVTEDVARADFALARDLGLRIHIDGGLGGGIWGGKRHHPVRDLDRLGLLGPDLTLVHCNNLAEDEYRTIAATGTRVTISPIAEMNVGHGLPAILPLLAAGSRPSLSGDFVTQAGGDLFGVMRAALGAVRGYEGRRAFEEGRAIDEWQLTVADMLDFATTQGAASLGLAGGIGALIPGYQADIVLIDARSLRLAPMNDPIATIVMQAGPGDVDTVMVGGRILKEGGRLTRPDLAGVIENLTGCRDRLFARAGLTPGGILARQNRTAWSW